MFDPCFVMQYLMSAMFFLKNHLAEEKLARCFALIVFLMSCDC